MNKGETVKVLDHGYLKFVDSMGTDEDVVAAARMSTGRGFVSWEQYWRCKKCDAITYPPTTSGLSAGPLGCQHDWQDFPRGDLGLLETLWRDGHATPFEMCELVVEVQAPLFVFREWHRHRTQSYNEMSARYAQMPDLHYLPDVSRIQKQSTANKQGSGEAFDTESAEGIQNLFSLEQKGLYDHYDRLCAVGVAREVARINTPVSRYSRMRAKANLRNWLGFLQLRHHPKAQYEIRVYAEALAGLVAARWPRTWALFEEHTLHAVKLSRTEAARVLEIFRHGLNHEASQKEYAALVAKLGGGK